MLIPPSDTLSFNNGPGQAGGSARRPYVFYQSQTTTTTAEGLQLLPISVFSQSRIKGLSRWFEVQHGGQLCSSYIFAPIVTVWVEEAWKDWGSVPMGGAGTWRSEIRLIPQRSLRQDVYIREDTEVMHAVRSKNGDCAHKNEEGTANKSSQESWSATRRYTACVTISVCSFAFSSAIIAGQSLSRVLFSLPARTLDPPTHQGKSPAGKSWLMFFRKPKRVNSLMFHELQRCDGHQTVLCPLLPPAIYNAESFINQKKI